MDGLNLRLTGFERMAKVKRDVRSAVRDRRNVKLRDLIVVRIIKRIKQGWKRHIIKDKNIQNPNRILEINNLRKDAHYRVHGSKSSRDLGREINNSELRIGKYPPDIVHDKALEEIAKIEVDAFLNQGKLLTDKHLREVENMVKSKWLKQNKVNDENKQKCYESKPDTYLPNYSKTEHKKKEVISNTPKITEKQQSRNIMCHSYNTKDKCSYSYTNDRYNKYGRVNASSCEKLPYGSNLKENNLANSIMVAENESRLITPTSTNYKGRAWIPKNKSNLSLHEVHDEKLLQIEPNNKIMNSRNNLRWLYQKGLNKTLDQDQPYYQNKNGVKQDSSTLSGLSLQDEWTEIELYNGILFKMRKEYERKQKRQKIEDIRNTLKTQVQERKKVKTKELEEKVKFDKIVETSVINDLRINDRIKLERQRKINREKELRDEQLYFKQQKESIDKQRIK